jgi:hypothetical protein
MKIKLLLTALFALLSASPLFSYWADARGVNQDLIDIYPSDPISYVPSIAIDSRGNPHVAWFEELPGGREIYYLYWDGSEWVDADGAGQESINISNNSTESDFPKLVLDALDRPHIAWEDGADNNRQVYYLYWNGSAWVDVTGSGQVNIAVTGGPLSSGHPDLALDAAGNPHITWQEGSELTTPSSQVYYAEWNGSAWTGAGGGPIAKIYDSPYNGLWTQVKVDSAGRPHVAWTDGPDDNTDIYYLYWNGAAWVDADGSGQESVNISNTPDYSNWASMVLDAADRPHIVFEDMSSGAQDVYYLHWDGAAWVDVTGSASQAAINVSNTYHYSAVPKIKLDASGTPHICWTEGAIETCDIFCVKWNGSAWTDETGSGTADRRIYQDDINSEWSDMGLDNAGNPIIAWSDGILYNYHDIYVLRWMPEGTPTITPTITQTCTEDMNASATWTPTVTGTATPTVTATALHPPPPAAPAPCWVDVDGSGYESKFAAYGQDPDVAFDSAGRPNLVWDSNGHVYFMKWDGSSWVDVGGTDPGPEMISLTVISARKPKIRMGANDRPCVAFLGGDTSWTSIYYVQWNGSVWTDVDGYDVTEISVPLDSAGYSEDYDFDVRINSAMTPPNVPHLAWSDFPEGKTYTVKDIFYLKWGGSSWVDADGSGQESSRITYNTAPSTGPSLKISSVTGNACLAWTDADSPASSVYYAQWNGVTWTALGGTRDIVTNPLSQDAAEPSLALDGFDRPCVAFTDNNTACFLRWDGGSWVDAGGAGQGGMYINIPGQVFYPSLDISALSNNLPHIGWYSPGGIYYTQWDGSAWVDADNYGTESVKIDSSSGLPARRAVARLINGVKPAIVWWDGADGYGEINFLQYPCPINTQTITQTLTPTKTVSPTASITPTPSLTQSVTPTSTVTITPTPFPDGFFGVVPNPFNPRTQVLKFYNVPQDSYVIIYSLSGEFVVRLETVSLVARWTGRNTQDRQVSPGIYYYVIKNGEGRVGRTGKIFVISH